MKHLFIKKLFLSVFTIFSIFFCQQVFSDSIESRFNDGAVIRYKVYFNAIPSGELEWKYLGRQMLQGKEVDVLSVDSDAKIAAILDINSDETIYLDAVNFLPLKVERDIVFFGKKESITEIYNQEEGYVKIVKKSSSKKEKVIKRKTPIRHVFSLLYFFPPEFELKEGNVYEFTLPTQTLKVYIKKPRELKVAGKKKECHFLLGRGAKHFNLWLDKEKLIPLRLEFIMPLGKITLVKETKAS